MLTSKNTIILVLAIGLSACSGGGEMDVDGVDRSTANNVAEPDTSVGSDGALIGPDDSLSSETPLVTVATGPASITDVLLVTGQSNALGSETTFDPVLDQPVDLSLIHI